MMCYNLFVFSFFLSLSFLHLKSKNYYGGTFCGPTNGEEKSTQHFCIQFLNLFIRHFNWSNCIFDGFFYSFEQWSRTNNDNSNNTKKCYRNNFSSITNFLAQYRKRTLQTFLIFQKRKKFQSTK